MVGGGSKCGVEKWRLKLTSAKVEVEVEAELGNYMKWKVNDYWEKLSSCQKPTEKLVSELKFFLL